MERLSKILVTGNLGYIGYILTEELLKNGYEVVGIDTNFYRDDLLYEFNFCKEYVQIKKDIRNISKKDIKDVDSIIHLAALSNDPLGEINPTLTNEINLKGSIRLAKLAKKSKVSRFLFSSSCSIYGETNDDMLNESAPVNPLTAYAHSKVNLEEELSKLSDEVFSPVYLRNGTAYGVSPNIRFDVVVNNLMGWAYTTKEIKILSDGKAWRPIVHIKDITNAFLSLLIEDKEKIHNQAFNVGLNSENYQVKQIAEEIHNLMPDCDVKILGKDNPDQRNYIVNFDKIKKVVHNFKSQWDLKKGIKELYGKFEEISLNEEMFQNKNFTRIKQLKYLLENRYIDDHLYWNKN